MSTLLNAVRAAIITFRKEFIASDANREGVDYFGLFDARRLRYDLHWAFYEGTAYDSGPNATRGYMRKFKADNGIYAPTRPIMNFANRLGEFYANYIYNGALDPEAGDGTLLPSAIPIETENETLRPAIGTLWKASNWQNTKSIWTRNSAVFGDSPLMVVDDPQKQRVYLKPIHPKTVMEYHPDEFGNVKSYVIYEMRPDPLASAQPFWNAGGPKLVCEYHETCERDGDFVVYRTYRNRTPFAWNGVSAEWAIPYGFVPMVWHKHLDFGHETCGMSEYHAALVKGTESDDLGSKINDHTRKALEAFWLFSGLKPGDVEAAFSRRDKAKGASSAIRTELLGIFSSDANAKATPMMANLDISHVSAHLAQLLDSNLQDYPELRFDRIRVTGDASAKALREARKPAEVKINERRGGADSSLARAMQMAIAIGGWRGYEGYKGFNLDSYTKGDLDFAIGHRSVFGVEPLDLLEEEKARADVMQTYVTAGVPTELAAQRAGWTETDLAKLEELAIKAAQQAQPNTPTSATPKPNASNAPESPDAAEGPPFAK